MDVERFAALIRAKRGSESQQALATRVWNDPSRKSDISKMENARVANPQEKTVQLLCTALGITEAEMAPIREARAYSSADLDRIEALSRRELEDLTARFGIENPYDKGTDELRGLLTDKANEHRALVSQIAALPDHVVELEQLKTEAAQAAEALDHEQVEELFAVVDFTETKISAQTKITRANNALLRHRPEQAFDFFSAAADSFRSVDPIVPAKLRLQFEELLYNHGLRYGGTGLALSERMTRDALENLDKPGHSDLWATGHNSLALALQNQGIRTDGAPGAQLLAQAVSAYRAALEVRTRDAHPLQWAATQNNLAIAMKNQGVRTDGASGAQLLAQAVSAYRAALEVYDRNTHSMDWAATQNNLGNALSVQAIRMDGATGRQLLAEAVAAYRAALKVYTRDAYSVDWAMTQNNLGNALSEQGARTFGTSGEELMSHALSAYRAALDVRTRDAYPVDWAITQESISECEFAQAGRKSTVDPMPHLTAAKTAIELALGIYDPVHMSFRHATATKLRSTVLAALDALSAD